MTPQMLSKVSNQPPYLVVLGKQALEWKLDMENHSIQKLENLRGGKPMTSCSNMHLALTEQQELLEGPGAAQRRPRVRG